MTGLNLGMAIEIVVAALLVLTIVYCTVLNRRLTRLRADEEVLRATIAELITATEIAERAILGLKATAAECEKSLGSRLVKAEAMIVDLDRQTTAGGEIVRRIGAIVGAAGSPLAAAAGLAKAPPAEPPARPSEVSESSSVAPPPAAPTPAAEGTARALRDAAQEAAARLAAYRRGSRSEVAA
jgi:hypothetical protein